MSSRVKTNLGDLGDTLARELTRCARTNREVVARNLRNLPVDAEREATAYYPQSGLKTPTGQLKGATRGFVRPEGEGSVTAGLQNDKVYAAIQEFGGMTKPHDITPRRKKALAWPGMKGGPVRKVHHPGSKIPPHRFLSVPLRIAGTDMLDAIRREVTLGD
jgi:hypothetical protein